MRNLIGFYPYSRISTNLKAKFLGFFCVLLIFSFALMPVYAQFYSNVAFQLDKSSLDGSLNSTINEQKHQMQYSFLLVFSEKFATNATLAIRDTVPEPRFVMRQSMILPGRGQITNGQVWKVPVIYSLFAGVIVYSLHSDSRYRGYRAAYYNSFPQNTDLRFGSTPSYIPAGLPPEQYRFNRNSFRNRRDLSFVGFLLAYGLNIADAYIFAHLRDFDVSDDLGSRIEVSPDFIQDSEYLAIRLNFRF
jgi:hypothetical protein